MKIKSPCIKICELNPKTKQCTGCFRTISEISNWNSFKEKEQKQILKQIKLRKLAVLIFLLFFIIFNDTKASEIWVGEWIAQDQWQSEFLIEVKKDGSAFTNYGAGDTGKWSIVDGNLEIQWKSGNKDYMFNGVMGYQRLSKNQNASYTSGLKKSLD